MPQIPFNPMNDITITPEADAVRPLAPQLQDANAIAHTRIFTRTPGKSKYVVVFEERTEPGQPPIIGTLRLQNWCAGDARRIAVTVAVEIKP